MSSDLLLRHHEEGYLVGDEVESWEDLLLPFEILVKSFLAKVRISGRARKAT